MSGYLLLEGGAEFGGQMAAPDREALARAGGLAAPVAVIPAAAAPDRNDVRAGRRAVRWFQSLGAARVASLPLVDRASADDPVIAEALRRARLIYLLGGFPGHLADSLAGSRAWQAVLAAWQAGAVVAGSSAGAMVLCDQFYDPEAGLVRPGLGLAGGLGVIPHFTRFGRSWEAVLKRALPASILMGIDEETGALARGGEDRWQVLGGGRVTLITADGKAAYGPGETFDIGSQAG